MAQLTLVVRRPHISRDKGQNQSKGRGKREMVRAKPPREYVRSD